jgi:hypothetical protein
LAENQTGIGVIAHEATRHRPFDLPTSLFADFADFGQDGLGSAFVTQQSEILFEALLAHSPVGV